MGSRFNSRRLSLLLSCALLTPLPAMAGPIAVRGGLHEDFNRIVFDFPQTPHYTLNRSSDGLVTIAVKGPVVTLAPDSLAARLSRISGLTSTPIDDGTQLSFHIAPTATLHDFLSGTSLVVDVQGQAAPVVSKAEAPVVATEPVATTTPTATPVAEAAVALPAADLPAVIYSRAGSSFVFVAGRTKIATPADVMPIEAPADLLGWRQAKKDGQTLYIGKANAALALASAAPVSPSGSAATITSDPAFALGARVVIKLAGAGPVASVTDPVVGDTLFVVPTASGQYIADLQRYRAFELLPTRQGLVIRPLIDKLQVRLINGGVEITAPGGLALSPMPPALPPKPDPVVELAAVAATDAAPAPRVLTPADELLPLEKWQAHDGETFTEARRRYQEAAANAEADDRARARLDLARFYLASGYGEEAAGLLRVVGKDTPDLANRPDYRGLTAMAQTLVGTREIAAAAADALGAPTLGDFEDVPLWRAAALAEADDLAGAAPLFAQNMDELARLREPLFTRFSDLATEAFLATNDNDRATRVIDGMAKRNGPDALHRPTVLYARGVLQSRIGSLDEAKVLWGQAATSQNELARSRAGLALIALGIADKSLKPADAAVQLERLRYGWRGDSLELDLLHRLADAYAQGGQLDDALDALDRAKRIAPDDTAGNGAIEAEQRKIFASLFLGPGLKNMPALKMLSTYRRYKQYAPTDPAQVQQVEDRLFDKMVAIDLLGPAAELLDGQLARAPDAAAKAKLGARSAGLRLLNGEPELAIKSLDATEGAGLPAELTEERRLLRARALGDQAQPAPALALLAGDSSTDAQKLAATITWRARDWPKAAAALAALLPAPDTIKGQASDEQAQLILRRAVALSLAGDDTALAELNKSYGPALQGTSQQASFALLVAPEGATSDRSLAAVQGQLKDVDLFKGFLDTYKK